MAKYDKVGTFHRVTYGANGESFSETGEWLYNPKLPFDVMGAQWMRTHLGAFYYDSASGFPLLELRACKEANGESKWIALGRAAGGTEWLSYDAPTQQQADRVRMLMEKHATLLTMPGDTREMHVALPLNTTGLGMFSLHKTLTDLEKAKLDHVIRGHPSLQRGVESQHHTTGGFQLKADATRQLAIDGCDLCGAYKIKLQGPKAKAPNPESDANATKLTMYYDSFGRVSTPSAQYGYLHAHLFWIPVKLVGWLLGSVKLDESTVAGLIKQVLAQCTAWLPGYTIAVVQMDSYSTNRSAGLLKMLEDGMVKPQFSPPGQHAFLGDVERVWYPLLVRALIWMRHAEAPKTQWFNAMSHALDVECTLVSRLHGAGPNISGYERIGLGVPDVSDMFPFYAAARFALDKDALENKWVERSAPGFWVGRNIDFVMKGMPGAGVFWDGHIHRTVVKNFHVTVSKFLDLTAPNNKRLPDFPKDSNPMPASQPSPAVPPAIQPQPPSSAVEATAAATRPRRPGADITYTAFTCEVDHPAGESDRTTCDSDGVTALIAVQAPSLAANIILHLCSGDYWNTNGISAMLRANDCGVIDVDASDEYGGGKRANMLNNGVFNFLWELTRAHRVIGIISGQRCSTGSLKRLDVGEGKPVQVLSQQHPDGIPGLDSTY